MNILLILTFLTLLVLVVAPVRPAAAPRLVRVRSHARTRRTDSSPQR